MEKTNFRTRANLKQLRALLEAQHRRCFYCRRWISLALHHSFDPNTATVDHFFPLVLGGRDTISNVVLACLGCNRRKGKNPPTLTDILKWNGLSQVWPHIQPLSLDRHVRERRQCVVCRAFIPMERLLESMRSDAVTKVCSKACWTIGKSTRMQRRRLAELEAKAAAPEAPELVEATLQQDSIRSIPMMEARPLTHTIADSLTIDDPLLLDERFINLLAKAETHQWKFRPKETAQLEQENQLATVLFERTKSCWEILKTARRSGLTLAEALEVALPIVLIPDEDEQP